MSQVIISNKIVFLSLKVLFVLTKSMDSDEMLHYALCGISSGCLLFASLVFLLLQHEIYNDTIFISSKEDILYAWYIYICF